VDAAAVRNPGQDTPLPDDLVQRARAVRLLILDVDGVLTDGRLYYSAGGDETKAFHIQDGLGIKLLQRSGVRVAVITGRRSAAVERRVRELGIESLYQGVEDKLGAFDKLLPEVGLGPEQAACMGDDLPDLPLIRRCTLGVTVPDAPELVRSHAHHVTSRRGGEGAVREVCELVMRAQGTLAGMLREYVG
jgi:3-deoxy-D-manno-octulosonate 8-phosphate phosphatase (KDO 8-P phosphatase)